MKVSLAERLVLSAALFLILALGFFSNLDKSMTWDEKCFIGAGKYILKTGNYEYDVFRSHPPLSFYINSIFLLPFKFDDKIYSKDICWEIGYDMVYHSGHNPKLILALARLPFIIMSMILALYVFYWARQMYGVKSGLFALGLYTFSTSLISQSNLAMTDFSLTFFIFLTVYYYWKFRSHDKKKYLYLTSIFLALALLSKLSGIILLPALFLLAIYGRNFNKKNFLSGAKELLTVLFIAFFVIFLSFAFQFNALKDVMPDYYIGRAYEEFDNRISSPQIKNFATYAFEEVPIPFPSYFFNIASVMVTSSEGIGSFLDGKILSKTPWQFPFAALFYKTQLSLLILLAMSLIFFSKTRSKIIFDEVIQILPVAFIIFFFTFNHMTAGLRHILPIYPFLILFTSKLAKINGRWIKISIEILFIHYVISSLMIFPNYMAYFNEIAGGPANGYKHLVGSNLDFGQDLPGLKKFMNENNIEKINLSYFGSIDPNEYVEYDYMPSPPFQHWVPGFEYYAEIGEKHEDCSEREGWIAVSASNLQNVHLQNKSCFDWLKGYEPLNKIGYSIFVYDLR